MGLISQIPVREGLISTLKPDDVKNPYSLIQRVIEDNNSTRHYTIGAHNKQHLFGNERYDTIVPRKQQLYQYLYSHS